MNMAVGKDLVNHSMGRRWVGKQLGNSILSSSYALDSCFFPTRGTWSEKELAKPLPSVHDSRMCSDVVYALVLIHIIPYPISFPSSAKPAYTATTADVTHGVAKRDR